MDEASGGRPPPPASPSPPPIASGDSDAQEAFLLESVRASGLSPEVLAEFVTAVASSQPADEPEDPEDATRPPQSPIDPRVQFVIDKLTAGIKRPRSRYSGTSPSPEEKRERRERHPAAPSPPADPDIQPTPRRRSDPRLHRSYSTGVLPSPRALRAEMEEPIPDPPAPLPQRDPRRARVVAPKHEQPDASAARPATVARAGAARHSDAARTGPAQPTASAPRPVASAQSGATTRPGLAARLTTDAQRYIPLGARSYATGPPPAARPALTRPGAPSRPGATAQPSFVRPGATTRPGAAVHRWPPPALAPHLNLRPPHAPTPPCNARAHPAQALLPNRWVKTGFPTALCAIYRGKPAQLGISF